MQHLAVMLGKCGKGWKASGVGDGRARSYPYDLGLRTVRKYEEPGLKLGITEALCH